MFKKSAEKKIIAEADRIASAKESLDALSWHRVVEISKRLHKNPDEQDLSEMADELLSIAQANTSLLGKIGAPNAPYTSQYFTYGEKVATEETSQSASTAPASQGAPVDSGRSIVNPVEESTVVIPDVSNDGSEFFSVPENSTAISDFFNAADTSGSMVIPRGEERANAGVPTASGAPQINQEQEIVSELGASAGGTEKVESAEAVEEKSETLEEPEIQSSDKKRSGWAFWKRKTTPVTEAKEEPTVTFSEEIAGAVEEDSFSASAKIDFVAHEEMPTSELESVPDRASEISSTQEPIFSPIEEINSTLESILSPLEKTSSAQEEVAPSFEEIVTETESITSVASEAISEQESSSQVAVLNSESESTSSVYSEGNGLEPEELVTDSEEKLITSSDDNKTRSKFSFRKALGLSYESAAESVDIPPEGATIDMGSVEVLNTEDESFSERAAEELRSLDLPKTSEMSHAPFRQERPVATPDAQSYAEALERINAALNNNFSPPEEGISAETGLYEKDLTERENVVSAPEQVQPSVEAAVNEAVANAVIANAAPEPVVAPEPVAAPAQPEPVAEPAIAAVAPEPVVAPESVAAPAQPEPVAEPVIAAVAPEPVVAPESVAAPVQLEPVVEPAIAAVAPKPIIAETPVQYTSDPVNMEPIVEPSQLKQIAEAAKAEAAAQHARNMAEARVSQENSVGDYHPAAIPISLVTNFFINEEEQQKDLSPELEVAPASELLSEVKDYSESGNLTDGEHQAAFDGITAEVAASVDIMPETAIPNTPASDYVMADASESNAVIATEVATEATTEATAPEKLVSEIINPADVAPEVVTQVDTIPENTVLDSAISETLIPDGAVSQAAIQEGYATDVGTTIDVADEETPPDAVQSESVDSDDPVQEEEHVETKSRSFGFFRRSKSKDEKSSSLKNAKHAERKPSKEDSAPVKTAQETPATSKLTKEDVLKVIDETELDIEPTVLQALLEELPDKGSTSKQTRNPKHMHTDGKRESIFDGKDNSSTKKLSNKDWPRGKHAHIKPLNQDSISHKDTDAVTAQSKKGAETVGQSRFGKMGDQIARKFQRGTKDSSSKKTLSAAHVRLDTEASRQEQRSNKQQAGKASLDKAAVAFETSIAEEELVSIAPTSSEIPTTTEQVSKPEPVMTEEKTSVFDAIIEQQQTELRQLQIEVEQLQAEAEQRQAELHLSEASKSRSSFDIATEQLSAKSSNTETPMPIDSSIADLAPEQQPEPSVMPAVQEQVAPVAEQQPEPSVMPAVQEQVAPVAEQQPEPPVIVQEQVVAPVAEQQPEPSVMPAVQEQVAPVAEQQPEPPVVVQEQVEAPAPEQQPEPSVIQAVQEQVAPVAEQQPEPLVVVQEQVVTPAPEQQPEPTAVIAEEQPLPRPIVEKITVSSFSRSVPEQSSEPQLVESEEQIRPTTQAIENETANTVFSSVAEQLEAEIDTEPEQIKNPVLESASEQVVSELERKARSTKRWAEVLEGNQLDSDLEARKAKKIKKQDFARFKHIYSSRDGALSLYQDQSGHIVAVDGSKLV